MTALFCSDLKFFQLDVSRALSRKYKAHRAKHFLPIENHWKNMLLTAKNAPSDQSLIHLNVFIWSKKL